jgi:uncharacterized protein (DUF934 family)
MQKIIKDNSIAEDHWCFVSDEQQLKDISQNASSIFLDYDLWCKVRDNLDSNKLWGVILNSDQEPSCLNGKLQNLTAIALNFNTFMDGRSFSQARELREKYQFAGEIRAIGDFIRDQLFYLKRCGVNAFQFSSEANLADALESLGDFSDYYQASATDPQPLFRRR